jgi:hypothetical protein
MSETATSPTVRVDHGGETWDIPEDLIALQKSWDAASGAVDTLVDGDDTEALKLARAHRLDLTDQLVHHPWLLAAMADGRRFQADSAMKAAARAR